MKKKYLNLFVIDSIGTFLIILLFFILSFFDNEISGFNYTGILSDYKFSVGLSVVGVALFISVICMLKKKFELDVDSLIMPISYLVFAFIIAVVSCILNCYVIVQNMHFAYYYRFIIINYLFLSSYTLLSFKK